MNNPIVILSGWAVSPTVLEPIFGSKAVYTDINPLIPSVISQDRLIPDWEKKLKELLFPEKINDMTLIGWSTGAIVALAIAPLIDIKKLVLISATPSFCRRENFRFGMRPHLLQSMIDSIKKDKNTVLRQFYSECGFKKISFKYTQYSDNQLICGLQFLEQANLVPLAPLNCPVYCIHGSEDRIVAVGAGKYLCEQIRGNWLQIKGPHAFFSEESFESEKIIDFIFPERNRSDVTV